jgi:hypothetical protein
MLNKRNRENGVSCCYIVIYIWNNPEILFSYKMDHLLVLT